MARAGQQIGIAQFFSEVAASDIRPVVEERAILISALCQKQMLKARLADMCAGIIAPPASDRS
jgi:hypothetical protein